VTGRIKTETTSSTPETTSSNSGTTPGRATVEMLPRVKSEPPGSVKLCWLKAVNHVYRGCFWRLNELDSFSSVLKFWLFLLKTLPRAI
jgi:hypothetical protein